MYSGSERTGLLARGIRSLPSRRERPVGLRWERRWVVVDTAAPRSASYSGGAAPASHRLPT